MTIALDISYNNPHSQGNNDSSHHQNEIKDGDLKNKKSSSKLSSKEAKIKAKVSIFFYSNDTLRGDLRY
jgi:hypothetical protein